jgi:hypothetical protein
LGENRSTECSKGNKTVPGKVATARTEDGHRQSTKSGYSTYRGWTQTEYQKWLQHVQRMDKDRVPKVATTRTEDGHRQSTKTSVTI